MNILKQLNINQLLINAAMIAVVCLIILALCRQLVPRWAENILRDITPILIVLVIMALLLGTLIELFRLQFGRKGDGSSSSGKGADSASVSVVGPATAVGTPDRPVIISMQGSVRSTVKINGGYHSKTLHLGEVNWAENLHQLFQAEPWVSIVPSEWPMHATVMYDEFVSNGARLAVISVLEQIGFSVDEQKQR